MEQLWRLKETVIGYLSPAKRRRTVGPGTPLNDATEHRFLSPSSEPLGKKKESVLLQRIGQKYLSPSDTKNSRKRKRQAEEDEIRGGEAEHEAKRRDGADGRVQKDIANQNNIKGTSSEDESAEENLELSDQSLSLTSSIEREINPDDSISQGSPIRHDGTGGSEDSELIEDLEEAFEEEIDVNEVDAEAREKADAEAKVEQYLARQAELELRKESVQEVKASGDWHPHEIYLFERLAMRSFEALIPESWRIDFPTLPDELFSTNEDETFINANCRPSSHAIKALQSLLNLGVRVRDNIVCDAPTERLISREVNSYIKWSERDGGYALMRYLPVLTVVTSRPNQSITAISNSITSQLNFLAEKHRAELAIPGGRINEVGEVELYTRPPPLLYGMIIAQTMIIFVTLDSAKPNATLRHLSHFQFKEKNMDVWNGFAIAMMAIVARNYLMDHKDYMEIDDDPVSDVDA